MAEDHRVPSMSQMLNYAENRIEAEEQEAVGKKASGTSIASCDSYSACALQRAC